MLRRLIPGIVVILVGLVGLTGREASRLQAAPEMAISGQFGGASYAVALRQAQDGAEQPPYLILGVGPRLVVLDATRPEQPVKVGESEILPGVVRALALSGSLVFAATGLGGLQVIDLAEPARPAVIASYDTGGYLEDLAVAGSVVYLASTPKWDGSNWQVAGAKGANDRTAAVASRLVDYTEVGAWLEFDVTTLVQQGYRSFILYGAHAGVNKAIYFPSNEYWDASKRPILTIRYDQ